jgi:hypothetical protein
LILPRNEERDVLELSRSGTENTDFYRRIMLRLWVKKLLSRWRTHTAYRERNRKKPKKGEWDTDFFSFSSLPPVKVLQEATLHALSISPNNLSWSMQNTTPHELHTLFHHYCQSFSSSISWQISYFLLRFFTQDWAIGPHTLLH